MLHLVGIISIIYLLIHIGPTAKMLRNLKLAGVFFGAFLWFIYLLYSVILLNQEDWHSAVSPLYFLIDIIPFGMMVRIISKENGWSIDEIINLIIAAAIIQALLAVAAFFIPELHTFFIAKMLDYGANPVIAQAEHRNYGFAIGLAYAIPIFQTVIALLVIHPSRKINIFNYIMAILLFFSAIINARTAIVTAVIGIFSMVVLDRQPLKKRLKYGVGFAALVGIMVIILQQVVATFAPMTFYWIANGFKEIFGFITKGETQTKGNYFAYMMDPNKYQIPDNLIEILFGAGHRTMGMAIKYGYASDIGYINDLWRGGIIYIILLYFLFMAIMWSLRKHTNPRISFLGTFMLILYPFINIKGVAADTNTISYFLFLLYIMCVSVPNNEQLLIRYRQKSAEK